MSEAEDSSHEAVREGSSWWTVRGTCRT